MTKDQALAELKVLGHRAYIAPDPARAIAEPFGLRDDDIPWKYDTVDSKNPHGLWHATNEWGDEIPDGERVRGVVVFQLVEALYAKTFDTWLTHNWDCPAWRMIEALREGVPVPPEDFKALGKERSPHLSFRDYTEWVAQREG